MRSDSRSGWDWTAARCLSAAIALLVLAACQPRPSAADPVFSAVRENDGSRLGQYLAEGGDPNRLNATGDSLMHVATGSRGGMDVLQRLLTGGADPNIKNRSGRTPLHNAAGWCHVDMVELLLQSGASPTIEDASGEAPVDGVCSGPLDVRHEVIEILRGAGG